MTRRLSPSGTVIITLLVWLSTSQTILAQISWSTITNAGLRNLPASAFIDITAEQIGSIPPQSISWILREQVRAIPPAAFSGFNASQLATLTDSCSAFSANQVYNIQGSAFNGITGSCYTQFLAAAYAGLTADHVINFSESVCRGMGDISNIPVFAFVSITPQCVSRLSRGACGSFNSALFSSLPATTVAALTATCSSNFPVTIFIEVTAEHISWLQPETCSGLRAGHISNMFAPAAAGLTRECVTRFTFGACDGLIGPVTQNLSPQGLAGLSSQCIWSMPLTAFGSLPSHLFASFTPVACQGFRREHVRSFPVPAASFLTAQCVANFGTGYSSACGGLPAEFLAQMSPSAISGFTSNCMWNLPAAAFALMTAEQYAAINPQTCRGLTSPQAQQFPVSVASIFSEECISNFGTGDTAACFGLRPDFLRALPPQRMRAFTRGCLRTMREIALQQVTSEHIRNLAPASCSGLQARHVRNFPPEAAPGLTSECLRSFSTGFWEGCSGLTTLFVGNMTAPVFSVLNSSCIADMPNTAFETINSAQLQQIQPQSFQGFRRQHFEAMSDNVIQATSLAQLEFVTPEGFSGISVNPFISLVNRYRLPFVNQLTQAQTARYSLDNIAEFKSRVPTQVPMMTPWNEISAQLSSASWLQIALLLQTEPRPVFTDTHIAQLSPSAVAGLRADHIELISDAHFVQFTPIQAQFFVNDTTAAISAVQLMGMQDVTFGNMSDLGTRGLNPGAFPGLTPEHIARLRNDQLRIMSCPQLRAFSEEQRALFRSQQEVMFQSNYNFNGCSRQLIPTMAFPSSIPSIHAAPHTNRSNAGLSDLHVGLIVGGVVLFVVLILILSIIVGMKRRKKRRLRKQDESLIGKPYFIEGAGWMQIVGTDDKNVMMVPYTRMK